MRNQLSCYLTLHNDTPASNNTNISRHARHSPSTVLLLRTALTRMMILFFLLVLRNTRWLEWKRTLSTGLSFLTSLVTMWALRSLRRDTRSPPVS